MTTSMLRSKRRKLEVLARNQHGEKQCNTCWEWLDESEFSLEARSASDGLAARCKPCGRFWRYGLTRADVARMLAAQGNQCPICFKSLLSLKDFSVDHDHACCPTHGRCCGSCTRGLICKRCNIVVLSVLENEELVQSAMAYLGKT